MKLKRLFSYSTALALVCAAFLTGCDYFDFDGDKPDIKEPIDYGTELQINEKTFFAPDIPSYFDEPLKNRSKKIIGVMNEARVIVATSLFISQNEDQILEFLRVGGVLIEVEPNVEQHNAFFGKHDLGTIDEGVRANIFAVCKKNIFLMSDIFKENKLDAQTKANYDGGDEVSDFEEGEEKSVEYEYSSYVLEPVPVGRNSEYCNTKLNSLVKWVNEYAVEYPNTGLTDQDPAVPSQVKELSELISNSDFTVHYTYTVNVNIDNYQICKVALSSADKISRNSTIDVDLYVTPFYAYQDASINPAGRGGDYYFVQQKVTSHNAPMYGSYRKKHGAVVTQANAFWLSNMRTVAQLCTFQKMSLGFTTIDMPIVLTAPAISFEQTPSPSSTGGSGSYSSGFSAALNIAGQAGVLGGNLTATINIGGTFTWSTTQTHTVSDYGIELLTTSDTRAVEYHYKTLNTMEDDNPDKAVPAIGRTDRTDEASWCWHVNSTQDGDTNTAFSLMFTVDPIYGFMYRHSTWSVEGHTKTCSVSNSTTSVFTLPKPNRTRMGVIKLTSTKSNVLSDVQIIDNTSKAVVASFSSIYKTFDTVMRQVPIGNYSILFNVYNGDDSSLLGSYKIASVDVETAKTTEVSTLDAVRIE